MKIGFKSSGIRNNLLKNGKELKNYGNGRVYIRPSMTYLQREKQKGMIGKAKEARANGKKIQVRVDFHGSPYYYDADNFTKLGNDQTSF